MKQLRDIMTTNVVSVFPSTTLREIARLMEKQDVGIIPVREGARVCGVITDRDMVIRALADGKNPDKTRADEIMSTDLIYCNESDSLKDAAKIMQRNQVRRLLVLDSDGLFCGVVSLGDLATALRDRKQVAKTIQKVSETTGAQWAASLEKLGLGFLVGGLALAGLWYVKKNGIPFSIPTDQRQRAA